MDGDARPAAPDNVLRFLFWMGKLQELYCASRDTFLGVLTCLDSDVVSWNGSKANQYISGRYIQKLRV
jgi:hypothetical protein